MANPWEEYADNGKTATATAGGPWEEYSAPQQVSRETFVNQTAAPKSPSYASGLTSDLVSGAGHVIGGMVNYAVSPSGGGPANMVANVFKPNPSMADLNTGIAKGAASGGISLANLATTPGRFLASGAPAFLGTMAGGGNYNQAKQAYQEQMQGGAIPQPQALQPTNQGQQIGATIGSNIPGSAVGGGPIGSAEKIIGTAAEKTFTNALIGELGLLKPLAKKLGPTMAEAKDNLSGIIQKYNLSDVRGFNSAFQKADELASRKTAQADRIVNRFALKHPTGEKYDVSKDVFKDIRSNVGDYVRPGEEPQALNVLDNIEQSVIARLKANGYQPGRTVPIDQLVDVKRSLNPRFANKSIADDPVKEKMYETAYLKMMDEINAKVPKAGKLNKEARDIWLAKDAMEEAAGRNDKLTNTIFGTAIGAAGAAGIITHPQVALPIAAAATGAELLRRGVTQGRALSLGIQAGRGLQTLGNLAK